MKSSISTILLTGVALLYVSSICQSRLCLSKPKCYCSTSKIGVTKILCKYVNDVQPINSVLNNYTHVYSLRIYGKYLKSVPSKCFENKSISILEISSPLDHIAEDALYSINSLEIVNLNGTMFTTIPEGATKPDFRILEMSNGVLLGIDAQLQNLMTTAEFLFNNNKISYIVENAFENATSLTNLDLSHNLLKTLNISTFRNIGNLKRLNLAYNQLISVDGLFYDVNLEMLNLYGNNLNDINNAFNEESSTLRWLDIGGNKNLKIDGSTFNSPIKELAVLSLKDNQFENLDADLIKNLKYLQNLYLNGNNLTNIPKDFFAGSKYIRNIELSKNKIESMENLLSFSTPMELPNLKHIALDENEISYVNINSFYQNVVRLNLSGNRLTAVKQMDFINLTSATSLNLSRNPLTNIEAGSFAKQQSLRTLDLSFTRIKTLNQSLVNLNGLNYLRITSSSLQTLENQFKGLRHLKYAYLDGNSVVSVASAFSDNHNLSSLNLARNNLTTLMNGSLPITNLTSHSLLKLWLAENPFSCDCRLLWMLDWLQNNHSKLEDKPLCQSPSNLRGIQIKDLNKTLLEEWKEDCPEGCECKCIVAEENALTDVDCSKKNLISYPDTFPRNAMTIDASGNKFAIIEFNTTYYPKLEILNLEGNKLSDIYVELSTSIKNLYLARNNLSVIPYEGWNNISVNEMTLSMNPWICNCSTWNFRQWLINHNSSVKDLQEIKCGDNGRFNNEVIINLTYENLCPKVLRKDKSVIIVAIFSVLLLLTCCILFLLRKLLLAILYSYGCICLRLDEDYDFSFDAFLLFADEDDEFALGVIEEGLEADSRGYRLFVPSRQILLSSTPIGINSSVADCCKVIVVLSSNFLRNSQCMQLLKTAMACSLEKTAQRFIFITIDGLPPELELDAVLKCLVRRSVCLKWREWFFWTKLKYHLPKKSKTNITSNDEESERLL